MDSRGCLEVGPLEAQRHRSSARPQRAEERVSDGSREALIQARVCKYCGGMDRRSVSCGSTWSMVVICFGRLLTVSQFGI